MKLDARLVRRSFSLHEGHRSAATRVVSREVAVVVLRDGEGGYGLGELAPLPGYSSETLDEAIEALKAIDLDALLLALHAGDLERADALTSAAPASARAASESACLDLLARRAGVSVAVLLGADPAAKKVPARLVDLDADIDALAPAPAFKRKLASTSGEELEAVRRLRRTHQSAELRLDANRALDPARDGAALLSLSGIAFVEEPYLKLDSTLEAAFPVALDETLRALSVEEVEAILASRSDITLVLKPTTLGFVRALRLARLAKDRGARAIASHCFEGPIGYSLVASLALSLDEPHPGLDSAYGPFDGAIRPHCLCADGSLEVVAVRGFGIEEGMS